MDTGGKKTAAAIPAEITRAVDPWLHVLCNGQRKTGNVDLEASEMRMRSAMPRLTTKSYVPNPFARQSAESKYRVPMIRARTATTASSPPMSHSIERTRSVPRECVAGWPGWAQRLLSITDASR